MSVSEAIPECILMCSLDVDTSVSRLFVLQSWRAIRCINALLIMAEHPPLLDTAQILSSDISLLSAPIVSADGTQQVRKWKCKLPCV